jgi:hypothetical protein
MKSYMNFTNSSKGGGNAMSIITDPNYNNYNYLGYNYAHLSHFRKYQYFKYESASITTLVLDLNYLNCFFLPTLTKIAKTPFSLLSPQSSQ